MAAVVTFLKVVECNSFQDAGRELGLSRSAISKRIAQLESHLGATLLNRNTRALSVTDVGASFYGSCREISSALERAAESVRGSDAKPVGVLRASIPCGLGPVLMPGLMKSLREKWPELRVNLDLDDEFVDLVGGGYDVVIRIVDKLADSNLIAKRIATTRRIVVGAPGYFRRHGIPESPAELSNHRCLCRPRSANTGIVWSFVDGDEYVEIRVSCALTANSSRELIVAACNGGGLLYVPEILVARELMGHQLQAVLSAYSERRRLGVYAIHPYKGTCPAKVRVFTRFVEQCLNGMSA